MYVTDAQVTVTILWAVQLAQMTQPQGWGKERQEGGWEGVREGGREGRRGEGESTLKQGGYYLALSLDTLNVSPKEGVSRDNFHCPHSTPIHSQPHLELNLDKHTSNTLS